MRLVDIGKLKTELYERFHEDGSINNIMMVPLGEVIKFCDEQPEDYDLEEVIRQIKLFIESNTSDDGSDWYEADLLNKVLDIVKRRVNEEIYR